MSAQNSNFFIDLVNYFTNQGNKLQSQAKEASIFDNKGDVGTTREDILFNFLQAHIPARCNIIKGGFVFDSMGNKSRQIDLLVVS